jgi:hypothetical protein
MLFKEMIAVYSENDKKTHIYKIQLHRLLRQLGHILVITSRVDRVK